MISLLKIDKEDRYLLEKYNWYISTNGYIVAHEIGKTHDKRIKFYLHRLILNAPTNKEVDHINLDKLDVRRCNLRLVTSSQNKMNKGVQKNSSLKLKGITFEHGKYRARIQINKKRFNLGLYKTKEEAAKSYDEASSIMHGEFGYLNNV